MLPDEQIAQLLGRPTAQQEKDIRERMRECLKIANEDFGNISGKPYHMPVVVFDLKGRTAGYGGAELIRLNIDLLHKFYDEMLTITLPHEVAHSVICQRYPYSADVKAHGWQWAHVMHLFDLPADRTHDMPTKPARVHPRKHVYMCTSCGKVFNLTKRMHNSILRGRHRICALCHTRLEYQGEAL